MRRFLMVVAVLAANAAAVLAQAPPSPRPVLVLDKQDQPWAAWVERRGPVTVARVAHWDGTNWQSAGTALNREPRQSVASVSLALAPDGTPWAAWGEAGLLHVTRWTGSAWEEPAPSVNRSSNSAAERPELKIDSRGRPWVLWSEVAPSVNADNVYLAFLDGKSWSLIDNGTLTTDLQSSSRSRSLALGPGDKPVAAFSQLVPGHDYQVFAGPWAGTQWTSLGGTLNLSPDAYAGFPSLVLDPQGYPVVAFLQASAGSKIIVKRWTGSQWTLVGTPGSLGARNPKVALSLGQAPVVAAIERLVGITVRQRSKTGWVDLGQDVSTPGAFVDTLDVAVDSQGDPWVLWAEDDAKGQRLGLSQWTGTRWEKREPPPFTASGK
jgi:hypothetical protein